MKLIDGLFFLSNAIITQIQLAPSNEDQVKSLYQNRFDTRKLKKTHEKVIAYLNTFFISIN